MSKCEWFEIPSPYKLFGLMMPSPSVGSGLTKCQDSVSGETPL